ncbi:phospholipid-binding lipoprotein MlaA [Colwellia chukchiensis]|uniref:Phospholipid-binding lipoprotein MlaA n=1 Tax=Colwellia chukchiensis TaxID=641665 RepID=A0A1H7HZS9_9GAMM|nr:VacJ family lipoprotein [Colwellia chukchiensis]SEK55791.1 phospholipid-binding lipoprotein MlaA [Colwellia chukchiensis]
MIKLAIKFSMALVIMLWLSGCSSAPNLAANAVPPLVDVPAPDEQLAIISGYADPWQGMNRRIYYFNAKADQYLILPLVRGYRQVTPDIVEQGISNFFNNLAEVKTFLNALLQLKPAIAAQTLGRFVVNSTIGVAGLVDVATPIGIVEQNEDFGQTLGFWGLDSGPYLVLPLLGPSSLRDATGFAFDTVAYQQAITELGIRGDDARYLNVLGAVDSRATLPFRYYASGSAFEYERLRLLYSKYREIQLAR